MKDDNDVEESSDCEDIEDDLNDMVPTTDLPEIILVEEDEFTEKIDESSILNNIREVQQSLDDAVKENKVNQCMTPAQPELTKLEESQPKLEKLEVGTDRSSNLIRIYCLISNLMCLH